VGQPPKTYLSESQKRRLSRYRHRIRVDSEWTSASHQIAVADAMNGLFEAVAPPSLCATITYPTPMKWMKEQVREKSINHMKMLIDALGENQRTRAQKVKSGHVFAAWAADGRGVIADTGRQSHTHFTIACESYQPDTEEVRAVFRSTLRHNATLEAVSAGREVRYKFEPTLWLESWDSEKGKYIAYQVACHPESGTHSWCPRRSHACKNDRARDGQCRWPRVKSSRETSNTRQ